MSDPMSDSESLLPFPQTQSTSPQYAQRTASRRRGVRLHEQQSVRRPRALWPQPNIVARFDPSLRYSPTPAGFPEIVSNDPSTSRAQRAMLGLDFAQTGGARDGVEHRYELQVRFLQNDGFV